MLEYNEKKLTAIFKGKNGSMGLSKGEIYNVIVYQYSDAKVVISYPIQVPYKNMDKFLENWKILEIEPTKIKKATIVQYTHNKQETYTVNDIVKESKVVYRQHHYQIKFNHGNEDEDAFIEFVFNKGGNYEFIDDINTNEPPEEYSCWCECMEDFLLQNGYKPVNIGKKSDVWEVRRKVFTK